MENLKQAVEELKEKFNPKVFGDFVQSFLDALNKGIIRSAQPNEDGNWVVNTWVKEGILLLFKYGNLKEYSNKPFFFADKDTLPLKPIALEDRIRIVPGGTSIRSGSYIAPGVICMPPVFVNVGAYVDEGSMLDSHSLVGSCAQIGRNVHLSAGSQIGGVLEPIGARPVIVEDDVFIGGNCGIYEGVLIRKGAVVASGVILTSSTKIFDVVNETIYSGSADSPLVVPENAVVVAGSRKLKGDFAEEYGLSVYSPIIIKYRDERTNTKSVLEQSLRSI